MDRLDQLRTHLNNEIGTAIYEDDSITAYKLLGAAQVAPKPIPIE